MELQLVGKAQKIADKSDPHCIGNPARQPIDPIIRELVEANKQLQSSRQSACLSVRHAAAYLTVKEDYIRNMIYNREIQIIQRSPRSKILIPIAELNRWIEKNTAFM